MIRGLYTAYTGMRNEQKRLDIISNNVANSATVGYKAEGVSNQSFDDALTLKIKDASNQFVDQAIGTMNMGVKLGEVYTDFSQGSFRQTSETFDFAIEGNGFFQVNVTDTNSETTTMYTRDGSFTMASDGNIVDVNGNHLLGENGEIQVPPTAGDVVVDTDGSVYADGVFVDKIKLTDFEDYDYIEKYADNLYTTADGVVEKDVTGRIRQGYTEQSNVETVSEMVDMIAITRAYETGQKVITTIDGMIGKAVNDVGKV